MSIVSAYPFGAKFCGVVCFLLWYKFTSPLGKIQVYPKNKIKRVGKVMEISFHYMKPGGKYVLFGCCPPSHQSSLNPFEIYNKEITLIGVKINPFSFPKAIGWLKAMGSRYVDFKKLGIKTYSLSQYQNAMDDLKKGTISKALFKIE